MVVRGRVCGCEMECGYVCGVLIVVGGKSEGVVVSATNLQISNVTFFFNIYIFHKKYTNL